MVNKVVYQSNSVLQRYCACGFPATAQLCCSSSAHCRVQTSI